MAQLVLIRPPSLLPAVVFSATPGVPPLGLAYLAGSLKAANHKVRIIDSFGEAPDKRTLIGVEDLMITGLDAGDIIAKIPDDVNVIGITCMFSNDWLYVKVLMRHIREKFPHIPIIVGGEHVTGDPKYALDSTPEADIVVLGEGEETLVQLVSMLDAHISWKDVSGIAFRNKAGQVVVNPLRPRIKNLDVLPWPDWEVVPIEVYLSRGLGHGSSGGRIMPILASRGCPFRCAFCTNLVTWQSKWIVRSPELVIEEMTYYIKRYQITHFEFSDLTIVVRKDWIMDFCRLLMSKNLNVAWSLPSGTRAEALDELVLSTMFKAGCRFFSYAPESGSRKTLDRIHKQVDPTTMLTSMRAAVKVGFDVKANIVFGFPGQTLSEVLESFWYILKMAFIGIHDVPVFPFTPYPGTELFNQLVKEGKIRPNDPGYGLWLSHNIYNTPDSIRSWSKHIPNWLMKPLTIGGMGFFYSFQFIFRPWRFIAMLSRLVRRQPRTFLDRALQEILVNFVFEKRRRVKFIPLMEASGNRAYFNKPDRKT